MTAQSIRTFIAFEIDPAFQCAINEMVQDLKPQFTEEQIRWVKAENYHVTLRFLGQTELAQVTTLKEALTVALQTMSAFSLPVGKLMLFPPTKHPHTLIVNFKLNHALAELVRALEVQAVQLGFAKEKRPYVPHLSLGRILDKNNIMLKKTAFIFPEVIAVKEVVLFQSIQDQYGSVYTPLWRLSLQEFSHGKN